jgi:ACT domain-containing protein
MKKEIKTRHLTTTITVESDNTIHVKRLLHSDSNSFYDVKKLYDYLSKLGISSMAGYCYDSTVTTIQEIHTKTAEIELEIDRMLGEHNGIQKALTSELEALAASMTTPGEIEKKIVSAVEAERGKIFDIIARHRYGAAIEKFLEDNYK